jgi:transposase
MTYARAAVERAMKVYEVLVQALKGRQPWIHVAETLGLSARTVRRLRCRYEKYGFDGLFDHRRRTPSPRAVPVADLQRVLRLYAERYTGFNVRHFHHILRREHGVRWSYTFVRKALQAAHLVGKRRPRGRHRRRREPRPCFGELLHLDGSRHGWLALVPDTMQTLIVVVDDATKRLLYAQLLEDEAGESTAAIMTALREVLATHGLPGALYTDRAGWAPRAPRQRAARGGDPHGGRGQSVLAGAVHRGLHRHLQLRAGRSHQRVCARGPGGPRADPVSRRGARRGARQYRPPRRRALAGRQAARAAELRGPARPRPAASQRAALGVVGAALPGALHRAGPGADGPFSEYRHSGPQADRRS